MPDQLLEQLLAGSAEDRRILFRNATVITMDPAVEDLLKGDVLVEAGTIAAVGADLSEAAADGNAIVVDMTDRILMPGMCDAHRHCWQNQFRRILCDVESLGTYMSSTHGGIALHYQPDDIYVGNCVSVIGALDSGVTTVLDFSHNSRSPEHSDAAFKAYKEIGGRVVHASAPPNEGDWGGQWPDDVGRLASEHASDPLVTVRLGVDMSARWGATPEIIEKARKMGVGITVDGVCLGKMSSQEVETLGAADCLGSDVTLIHGTDLTDRAWEMIAKTGTRITLAPTSDEQIGIADGNPPIQKALDNGIRPSLSVDVEIALATDMFSQMRAVLATQRMQVAARRYHGDTDAPRMVTARDVLEFATVRGADDVGLGDVVGSITPGKEADLVAITAEEANNFPLNNAIGTIVLGADTRNIESVFVRGEVRKWDGSLVWGTRSLDYYRDRAKETRDRIMSEAEFELDVLGDGRGYPQGSPLGNLGPIVEVPS